MCNLSQGYYENGFKKGFEEGFKKGFEEGFEEGRQEAIIVMLKNGKTVEEIAKFMDVTIGKIKEIESQMELRV